jgi:hypothetical protein
MNRVTPHVTLYKILCMKYNISVVPVWSIHPLSLLELQMATKSDFHIGCSSSRFQIIVGWRYSHVDKHKLPTNHILKGHGNGLLDFHAPIEVFFNLQVHVTKVSKAGFRRRRRLVGGHGFEKTRVCSWHTQTYPTKLHLHLGGFVLIPTRILWVSGLHGNAPYVSRLH